MSEPALDYLYAVALATRYTRGRGVDVGDGKPLYPHFLTGAEGDLDFLCIRKPDPSLLGACLHRVREDGHVYVLLRHEDADPAAWLAAATRHCTPDLGWVQVEDERMETSWAMCFRRSRGGRLALPRKNRARQVLVVRYGAFGDHIMAMSVLPGLKEQGWYVTYQTSAARADVVRHNPYIDDLWVQDDDQVPNEDLGGYWRALGYRYRVINLSESVEGTWLAMPGRTAHGWPDAVRRKRLNVNYLEHQHDLAGVPYRFRPTFFPTASERREAKRRRAEINGPVVLWALAGSSVHKTYPWFDAVIAQLLLETDAHVVLIGDTLCQVLEAGWENEPRVHRRCGLWGIRETLAFAQTCDAVVGPETGVLSAMAFHPMRKVMMLSHSSAENLTKHWINTVALAADVPCHPCHRMHYGRSHCPRYELPAGTEEQKHAAAGAAACMGALDPEAVFEAILPAAAGQRIA